MFVDICLLTFMQIYVVINVIKEIGDKHRFVSHTKYCNEHSALDIQYIFVCILVYIRLRI